ncbi:TetR/AcrR family transcriptional regulator [Belliella sp. DSM 111904]|uniref:TetR/AcrR family transcriptional regulator n=1 Tax=Belliella filtrata TaxID=2923435 RepID=A0ABS9UW66_9BACT|nr:TetR/AcrR family transcriptional regulator [Belliella filtrata]MCH7408397.1 TetR/AcrR family transcriptional regulator [Belliella filtrata]
MERLLKNIRVDINEKIYMKDPFSSDLGREIVNNSLDLIPELGLEHFTFKKLAGRVGCTETAIYRYFENKHKLMLFLTLWYWGFLEQNLILSTMNLQDPIKRLNIAIEIIVKGPIYKDNDYVDPISLKKLIIDESTKAYMTKEVDEDYKNGFFNLYHRLGERIASIILEINPNYEFPKTLVSTVMESSLLQSYYSEHIPNLTDIHPMDSKRVEFFQQLVFKAIENEN